MNLIGAINKNTNQIVLAKNASKNEEYICIGCKEELIFKKGDVRIPHFSHKPNINCSFFNNSNGEESQIHKTAKNLLKNILENKKQLFISKKCSECCCECDEDIIIIDDDCCVELEYNFNYNGSRIADVAYLINNNIKYIFEIFYTHQTMEENRPEPWYEFNALELIELYNKYFLSESSFFNLNCTKKYLCNNCINFNDVGRIFFNQRGAGCGKTYESIQLLTQKNETFLNKNVFIYLTKAHSAKDVIYSELLEQQKRGCLDNLIEIECDDKIGKQYKMTYHNSSNNSLITVIIGTIDSFNYAIANKNNLEYSNDYFTSIIHKIKNGFINVSSKNKTLKYARKNPHLNENCLIIIDESQDLIEDQIKAFDVIVQITGIDVYVIGDKLQSIWGEKNVFTCIDNSNLTSPIIKNYGINKCLRFHNIHFCNFINNVIPFQKYNLPEITEICDENCKYIHENEEIPYVIFETPKIYSSVNYATDRDYNKIYKIIEYLKQQINYETEKYNYLPKNFMIIFPIVSNNAFAQIIEIEIQKYWIEKFDDKIYQKNVLANDEYWCNKINDGKFYKYIHLHKSDEGKSINLNESENSTRIISIHTSKGTGREVVFVLGITENTLKIFSKKSELVYDSLLHVALTRQKKKIYIGIEKNNDDIHNKFKQNEIIKIINYDDYDQAIYSISKNISYNRTFDYLLTNSNDFEIIQNNIIIPNNYNLLFEENSNNNTNQIIDMGHHLIRALTLEFYLTYYMVKNSINKNDDNQIIIILKKISCKKILECNKIEYVNVLRHLAYKKYDKKNIHEYDNVIPILTFNSNSENIYNKYSTKLILMIKQIQSKLRKTLINYELPLLCSLECVIIIFVIHTIEDGIYSNIDIMQIYSIIDAYNYCNESFSPSHCRKYECCCNHIIYKTIENIIVCDKLKQIILNHYNTITDIENIYNYYQTTIFEMYGINNLIYNVHHKISYELNDFNFFYKLTAIGYNEDSIIYFIIAPQYNKLNFSQILIKEILLNFVILNSKNNSNNYNRYKNKKIYSCIFTCDLETPIFHELNINSDDPNISIILKNYILHKYSEYNEIIFKFYNYCKNNELKPKNISSVEYTIEQINNIIKSQGFFRKFPLYILNFFEDINNQIKYGCKNNKLMIKQVMDKISTFEEFNKNIILFLKNKIGNDQDISDEIIEY